MSDDELNAIEARANAATPGPWEDGSYTGDNGGTVRGIGSSGESCNVMDGGWFFSDEDFEFILHSRADVPALIAEVRRLRAELEQRV